MWQGSAVTYYKSPDIPKREIRAALDDSRHAVRHIKTWMHCDSNDPIPATCRVLDLAGVCQGWEGVICVTGSSLFNSRSGSRHDAQLVNGNRHCRPAVQPQVKITCSMRKVTAN